MKECHYVVLAEYIQFLADRNMSTSVNKIPDNSSFYDDNETFCYEKLSYDGVSKSWKTTFKGDRTSRASQRGVQRVCPGPPVKGGPQICNRRATKGVIKKKTYLEGFLYK
jgi:hypothetical protein